MCFNRTCVFAIQTLLKRIIYDTDINREGVKDKVKSILTISLIGIAINYVFYANLIKSIFKTKHFF